MTDYAHLNERRNPVWDALWNKRPFGRVAISVGGSFPDAEAVSAGVPVPDDMPLAGPAGERPDWDRMIRAQLHSLLVRSRSRYRDDSYPALSIPRDVHGQSQSLAEAFGARFVAQGAESEHLLFPVPCIESPSDVVHLKKKPVEECLYGRAVEFARYAREVTGGVLSVRNPVMTGPLDTVNYLMGTTRLMGWIYEEPRALNDLLATVTEFLIDVIAKLQAAAAGKLCPDHASLDRGFALCSEVRALISAGAYEEFEAPYLRRIGQACGPYMIHSCGSWERTIPAVLADPNIFMIEFGCREMDLRRVCELSEGRLSLGIHQSVNLGQQYTWRDSAAFFRYVMTEVPGPAPVVLPIAGADVDTYLSVQEDLNGGVSGLFRWHPVNSYH